MADYAKLKVTELKNLLKERGISANGLRKQQMVDAIEADDAEKNGEETDSGENVEADEPSASPEAHTAGETSLEESRSNDRSATDASPEGEGQEFGNDISESVATPGGATEEEPTATNGVSATISREASSMAESFSLEENKRKRRSETPSLSSESMAKKLKAIDGMPVRLPEDFDSDVASAQPMAVTAESAEPIISNEDVGEDDAMVDAEDAQTPRPAAADLLVHHSPTQGSVDREVVMDDHESNPSLHPPTPALYIRNLVRPLQSQQLREHIVQLASSRSKMADTSIIKTFHLDNFRTHAFVVFASKADATRVRTSLHTVVWPSEPTRKALWVDYVPEEDVQKWVEIESDASSNRRDGKRWEVIYETTSQGVQVSLQEVNSLNVDSRSATQVPRANGHGTGVPNAPTGPRARPSNPLQAQRADESRVVSDSAFSWMDERFDYTTTKPKLYYKPVDPDLARRRLEELNASTGDDWDDTRFGSFSFAHPIPRRYTFEDGHKLVDGGPDIGNFGMSDGRGGYGGGGGRGNRGRWQPRRR